MKLSIIIPHCSEPEEMVKRLLCSIDYQLNVDWNEVEVLVVSDNSKIDLSTNLFNSCINFTPTHLKLSENVGSGQCRQYGLDNAVGDYIVFCDADDFLYSFGVLNLFLRESTMNKPDIFTTTWLEEVEQEGVRVYIENSFDETWLHGKMFKRQFLIDKNIRFHTTLRENEDCYFINNALCSTDNKTHSNMITYVWSWNANSITRENDQEFTTRGFPKYLEAIRMSMEWLMKQGYEKIPQKAAEILIYAYYMYYDVMVDSNYAKDTELECFKILKTFRQDLLKCNKQQLKELQNKRISSIPYEIELKETFFEFLMRVETLYKK